MSSLRWITSEFSPEELAAAEALGMRTVSAAFSPLSLGNRLFCCPHPACFGSVTLVAAARKEGEVVVSARRPPPLLLSYPLRLGSESVRGGGRGEKKEVDRDHVSVPSVLTFPSPSWWKYYSGIGQSKL